MGGERPPFMLFATANFSLEVLNCHSFSSASLTFTQEINSILRKNIFMGDVQFLWTMQTASYAELPREEGNPRKSRPMPSSELDSFKSEFIGKTLEELSGFLKGSPEDLQIGRDYFVVVDEETKEKGTMLMCKIVASGKVEYFRERVEDASLCTGNLGRQGMWEVLYFIHTSENSIDF